MTEWILSSSILVLIVITLRVALKGRIRLKLQYALWGLVLLRLVLPFSIGSTAISVANITTQPKSTVAVQTEKQILYRDYRLASELFAAKIYQLKSVSFCE